MTLAAALLDFVTRPVELLVRRWNWKAAFSSALVRALIFFFANLAAGWRAALGAMAAAYFFRALTSGFYGAMTQHFSLVEPEWQAAAGAMLVLPVVSHSLEFLLHWLRHTPVRRGIWVCPMGVDCDRFHHNRRARGAAERSTVIVYAGRLSPEKNLSLLIDTMALLDPADFRMIVAGAGIELERLRHECESRNISGISFLGHIADRDRLADLYANADIFMHPNPREPFGSRDQP